MIVIKTKRGASRDGVKFTFRSEYGLSDLNSTQYGQPINHPLQLDETGTRFCVVGSGNAAPCSRTYKWMDEILRINNVNADTNRVQQSAQWNSPGAGGELLNVYPGQPVAGPALQHVRPDGAEQPGDAQLARRQRPCSATVRYFVSGAYTSDQGAIYGLEGSQQKRARA